MTRIAATLEKAVHCSVLLALLSLMAAFPAFAAEAAEITHSQADAILDELKQIRRLLEGQVKPAAVPPGPQKRTVKVDGGYSLGSDTAPLTMVEFTDYQCPFCRGFENNTFDEI